MKHFRAKTEDKLRVFSNRLDFAIHKTKKLFTKEPSLDDIQNILIIELKRIGDIIVSTPTIRTLKSNFPDANLDIVVPPGMEEVLFNNPHLNKIISWDRDKLKENYQLYLNEIQNKYDLAIILHNGTYLVSKMLKEAKIPYRIGCTRVGLTEPKGFFLTRQLLPDKVLKHKIEDNLDVLKLINIYPMDNKHPEIYISPEAQSWLDTKLKEKKIADKDFVIVISLVSQSHPTWFKERFALLADKLIEKYKAKIIFVGTNKEKEFIYSVKRLMRSRRNHYWLGQTTIQGLFAIVNRANFVVGIDSAPTNIAAALDKPVVALFGAGDRTIWHPFNKNSISIQRKHEVCTACMKSYCKYKNDRYLECMKIIQVRDVLRAIERLDL